MHDWQMREICVYAEARAWFIKSYKHDDSNRVHKNLNSWIDLNFITRLVDNSTIDFERIYVNKKF